MDPVWRLHWLRRFVVVQATDTPLPLPDVPLNAGLEALEARLATLGLLTGFERRLQSLWAFHAQIERRPS